MKNCEYYEELIGAALDGEITAEEDKELRAHLESCEACRSFYEAMQAISGTDDALGDVPENFTANVMARVHETAAPAEAPAAPAGGRMMAAAPESAAADSSVTVTVTAENGAADDAVTLPDDGFFAGYLLLDEGETPMPERDCDYTITLDAPDGTESVYRLWVEEESLVWQKTDGDAAHLSPASPEAWSEILRNASR